jgi:hypothetical protein
VELSLEDKIRLHVENSMNDLRLSQASLRKELELERVKRQRAEHQMDNLMAAHVKFEAINQSRENELERYAAEDYKKINGAKMTVHYLMAKYKSLWLERQRREKHQSGNDKVNSARDNSHGKKSKRNDSKSGHNREGNKSAKKESPADHSEITCFKCGKKGHYATKCESKVKEKKCFLCDKVGHVLADCPLKSKLVHGNDRAHVTDEVDDSDVDSESSEE